MSDPVGVDKGGAVAPAGGGPPTAGPGGKLVDRLMPNVEHVQLAAGFLFMVLSGGIFLYSFISLILYEPKEISVHSGEPDMVFAYMLTIYGPAGFKFAAAVVLGLLSGVIGLKLIGNVRDGRSPVIREEDRVLITELIAAEKDKGIDQYIRLASLAGFSGNFTKLGLSGLPLATIGLTLAFVLLSLAFEKRSYLEEAAQLTLGAFLGSFVQRAVDRQKPPE